jgi:hypothetical protein
MHLAADNLKRGSPTNGKSTTTIHLHTQPSFSSSFLPKLNILQHKQPLFSSDRTPWYFFPPNLKHKIVTFIKVFLFFPNRILFMEIVIILDMVHITFFFNFLPLHSY